MKPVFYDCEICGALHRWEFNGDCREDEGRFSCEGLDALYGRDGWEERSMDERVEADGF